MTASHLIYNGPSILPPKKYFFAPLGRKMMLEVKHQSKAPNDGKVYIKTEKWNDMLGFLYSNNFYTDYDSCSTWRYVYCGSDID